MTTEAHGFDHPDVVPINTNESSDDVWDENASDSLVESQTLRIRREHHNAGYLEGITNSKETAIQSGFNDGYPQGATIGLRIGNILGQLQGNKQWATYHERALKDLGVESILTSEYWDENADPKWTGVHPLIEKWEKTLASLQSSV